MLKAVSSRTIVPPWKIFYTLLPPGKFLTQKYVWPTEKRHQMYQVRLEQFLTVQLYPSGTSVTKGRPKKNLRFQFLSVLKDIKHSF